MRPEIVEKDHFRFIFSSLVLMILFSLVCAIYVTQPRRSQIAACELLQIATTEADLAPAWYLEAGVVLERCGHEGAIAAGKVRACFAEARNGYRDSAECEAMQ